MADEQKILRLLEMLMNQKEEEKQQHFPSDEFTLGVFLMFIFGPVQPLQSMHSVF